MGEEAELFFRVSRKIQSRIPQGLARFSNVVSYTPAFSAGQLEAPTIDISHSTLNICTEAIAGTTMRIVWPTTFVTLSDDEARVSGNVSLRSPRR